MQMWVEVLCWEDDRAMAAVDIHCEHEYVGMWWVDEPILRMMTGCADEPWAMVGRQFGRGIPS
jgi:hypothetical protein